MADYLAQNQDEGTFTPEQLFAGEGQIVTESGQTVAEGQDLDRFQLVAKNEDGQLVAWNPDSGSATLAGTFSGVGTANDTITVNGQAVTLVAAADDDFEITIGGTAALTAAAFAAKINEFPDTFNVKASVAGAVVTLTALEPGAEGNAIAVSESGTGFSFAGGATALAGGGSELERKVYGVMLHACDATAEATSGQTVYREGPPFNHAALIWPSGLTTLAARQLALHRAGSEIKVAALGGA